MIFGFQSVVSTSSFFAGGGLRESKRAAELSELLGVKISPSQVSPLKLFIFFQMLCSNSLHFTLRKFCG